MVGRQIRLANLLDDSYAQALIDHRRRSRCSMLVNCGDDERRLFHVPVFVIQFEHCRDMEKAGDAVADETCHPDARADTRLKALVESIAAGRKRR